MDENKLPALPDQVDMTDVDSALTGDLPAERNIDASFFSYRNRRSTQLIENTGEPIKGRREWLDYDLIEATYVSSIKVTASGYEDHHEMELSFDDSMTGEKKLLRSKFDGASFAFQPKTFIRGFGLRPDLSWSLLKSQYISRVDVRGLEQKHFFEVVAIYENVSRERAKIEGSLEEYLAKARKANEELNANAKKILEQSAEIESNQEKIEQLGEELSTLTSERDEVQRRIESGISNEKERNERVAAIELDIRTLSGDRESLVDQIAESRSELKN